MQETIHDLGRKSETVRISTLATQICPKSRCKNQRGFGWIHFMARLTKMETNANAREKRQKQLLTRSIRTHGRAGLLSLACRARQGREGAPSHAERGRGARGEAAARANVQLRHKGEHLAGEVREQQAGAAAHRVADQHLGSGRLPTR